jgi:hypothetical protein
MRFQAHRLFVPKRIRESRFLAAGQKNAPPGSRQRV